MNENGLTYQGCQTKTISGRTCQKWSSQTPQNHGTAGVGDLNENHNFCRNPSNDKTIWCWTADPAKKFEYCEPLGVREALIQPGEKFDILLHGEDLPIKMRLRIIHGDVPCGGNRARVTTSIHQTKERAKLVMKEGKVVEAMFSNFVTEKVIRSPDAQFRICLCNHDTYNYLGLKSNGDPPCSVMEHYDIEGGRFSVSGPRYPDDTVSIIKGNSSDPIHVTVEGRDIEEGNALFVIKKGLFSCDMIDIATELQEVLLRQSKNDYFKIIAAIAQDKEIVAHPSFDFATHQLAANQVRVLTHPFEIPTVGEYTLCWKKSNAFVDSIGKVADITIEGLDRNQHFHAVYTPQKLGEYSMPFSLFIRGYKADHVAKLGVSEIELRELSDEGPCKGSIVAQTSVLNSIHFSKTEKADQTAHIHKFWKKFALSGSTLENLLADTTFPVAISFWSSTRANQIRVWLLRQTEVLPIPLFTFRDVPSPIACSVIQKDDGIFAYVVSKSPPRVAAYNITNPNGNFAEKEIRVTASISGIHGLRQPTGFEVIRNEVDNSFKLLLIDASSTSLLLLDENLQQLHHTESGFSLHHPRGISCLKKSDGSNENVCFIADSKNDRVIWLGVDVQAAAIVFRGSYTSSKSSLYTDQQDDASLFFPTTVKAFVYKNETLIYVAQENHFDPWLLLKKNTLQFNSELSLAGYRPTIVKALDIIELQNPLETTGGNYLLLLKKINANPVVQFLNVLETARVTRFDYFPKKWYKFGEKVILSPVLQDVAATTTISEFAISKAADGNYALSQFQLDQKTGILHGAISDVIKKSIVFHIIGGGAVSDHIAKVEFNVACPDGNYFNGTSCAPCEPGSFNRFDLVKTNDVYWSQCFPCGIHEKTSGGATSVDLCMCDKGYEKDLATGICTACKAGQWKETIGPANCEGKCPDFSSTFITAATTEAERKCRCLNSSPNTFSGGDTAAHTSSFAVPNAAIIFPGYYMIGENEHIRCLKAEQGYFAKGGYMSEHVKCPSHTSTVAENAAIATGIADTLNACMCQAGYEPVNPSLLADTSSVEYHFWNVLIEENVREFGRGQLTATALCVPCGSRRWKSRISSESCTRCPPHSFADSVTTTAADGCQHCDPGYYRLGGADAQCIECQENHFCVGSRTNNIHFGLYENRAVPCPGHTKTAPPFSNNDHPIKCMCDVGYEFIGTQANNELVMCAKTKRNSYKDFVGNTKGIGCPEGSITLSEGAINIIDCSCKSGYYLPKLSNVCKPCPKDSFCIGGRNHDLALIDKQKCSKFGSNRGTVGTGASSYADCLCKEGYTLFNGVSGVCIPCGENTYKSTVGNDKCIPCNENSGTAGKTASARKSDCLCSPGNYFNKQCVPCQNPLKFCPGGQMIVRNDVLAVSALSLSSTNYDKHIEKQKRLLFSKGQHIFSLPAPSLLEAKSLVPISAPQPPVGCPQNTRIIPGYSAPTAFDDCKCDRGYEFIRKDITQQEKVCRKCPRGYYKSTVDDVPSQCYCLPNFYFANQACLQCPVGAKCEGGFTEEATKALMANPALSTVSSSSHTKPYALKEFYLHKLEEQLISPDDWKIIPCPIKYSCFRNNTCIESMTDYLCSECKLGNTNNFDKESLCKECPSFGANVTLLVLLYIFQILFNIFMTYINVSAGYNRKSIHSIVIKIATNYLTCMAVLQVVRLTEIDLPSWVADATKNASKLGTLDFNFFSTSIDCLLRSSSGSSHAESFFRSMLFYAMLPLLFPLTITFFVFVIVAFIKHSRKAQIAKKLFLLQQTKQFGLDSVCEGLIEEYENDRIFMIMRYIPIPGESASKRIAKQFEDMIPVYVTVLFYVYTSTTSKMLSLLDCANINLGSVHGNRYFLRAAMSIECKISPGSEYMKYFILGISGLLVWGIGIPLLSFLALFLNRRRLNTKEIRLKYGFLHNGYEHGSWYWESVVFLRKFIVLIISNVDLFPTVSKVSNQIWIATVIAEIFLVLHLLIQPFDERSYSKLDTLENHSMSAWALTCILFGMVLNANLGGVFNLVLIVVVVSANTLFFGEVIYSLAFAYFDNVRKIRSFYDVPIIGVAFRFMGQLSSMQKEKEALVTYNSTTNDIELLIRRRKVTSKLMKFNQEKISSPERIYFKKMVQNLVALAVLTMKLDVIPGAFMEFALRLGLVYYKFESEAEQNKKSISELADGNLSQLIKWKEKEVMKDQFREAFKRTQTKLMESRSMSKRFLSRRLDTASTAAEARTSFIRNASIFSTMKTTENLEFDDDTLEQEMLEITDEQENVAYLFDQLLLRHGASVCDLYIAILKMQLRSSVSIQKQLDRFRLYKHSLMDEKELQVNQRYSKLALISQKLQDLLEGEEQLSMDSTRLKALFHEFEEGEEALNQTEADIKRMKAQLQGIQENPESYEDPDDVIHEEWFNEGEANMLHSSVTAREEDASQIEKGHSFDSSSLYSSDESD
ncbi:kringle domain-containing protein [Cardiosporidium cionae]|uniref:Kringle domain-containing protein n=1 Tax=Cardiosporidium cionae TaxID=476202 RepID=A0ABQ7JC34_9APIC|nr:kringle domain-containing protein [Cardiosporidium cionae]|eukprot:KAF8821572.1 kringle domain-containing protein [Cardiosporidium cionae]